MSTKVGHFNARNLMPYHKSQFLMAIAPTLSWNVSVILAFVVFLATLVFGPY